MGSSSSQPTESSVKEPLKSSDESIFQQMGFRNEVVRNEKDKRRRRRTTSESESDESDESGSELGSITSERSASLIPLSPSRQQSKTDEDQ